MVVWRLIIAKLLICVLCVEGAAWIEKVMIVDGSIFRVSRN